MPMSTDVNGSSSKYCINCYGENSFTQPELTVSEMQAVLSLKLTAMGFSEFMVDLLINDVPKLERWKKQARLLKSSREIG